MARSVFYDGLNLSLERGTGVATYCRMLAEVARSLQHRVGVVYSSPLAPAKDPLLREITLFDAQQAMRVPFLRRSLGYLADHLRYYRPVRPAPVNPSGHVVMEQFRHRLPTQDCAFVARNLFDNATGYFHITHQLVRLAFEAPPQIFHWTYPLPLRARQACNIYTIHDLVPLKLPFTTLDNKRHMFQLLKKIAATADHIVTVSENSRRDIIELLGIEERRVTNTYQAVEFPAELTDQPQDVIAEQLAGSFGLDYGNYLLFFGALEPKKNVDRLIEAYLGSGVELPLILVAGGGWQNEAELKAIAQHDAKWAALTAGAQKRRIHRFEYVSMPMLVKLIRGARAVLMPSLYEGFGLPVLEAMVLGTPAVASNTSSLPEVAGDAALLVNPYDTADIARAIRMIGQDGDLRAELARRGRLQAAKFTVQRYRDRVKSLYDSLA